MIDRFQNGHNWVLIDITGSGGKLFISLTLQFNELQLHTEVLSTMILYSSFVVSHILANLSKYIIKQAD